MKQLAFDLVEPPPPTLDNFVVGRNGELVQRIAALATAAERSLYLWGPPASGRTHLLRAALSAFHDEKVDAAAVDDVDRLDADGQAALFNLFNTLRERGGVLITAGNAPPARLALRADVATRLAWGLVYEVHPLSDDEKIRALGEHAAARGFALAPEVAQYLLARVPRDMRTLLAVLESLDRYSLESKRAVTVPLARELLDRTTT